MSRTWIALLGMLLLAAPAFAGGPKPFKNQTNRLSYAVGVQVARNFKKQGIDFNPKMLIQGLQDELAGKQLRLTDLELRSVMRDLQGEVRRRMAARRQASVVENRKKELAFLAANGKKKGVVSLPSGVQYLVLKKGSGSKPTASGRVLCHYSGTLLDGTQFDASPAGKPATLHMGRIIPGLKEALEHMPAGSHWKIFVPSKLAYGVRGAGADIGPNELLIFDVELLRVE